MKTEKRETNIFNLNLIKFAQNTISIKYIIPVEIFVTLTLNKDISNKQQQKVAHMRAECFNVKTKNSCVHYIIKVTNRNIQKAI